MFLQILLYSLLTTVFGVCPHNGVFSPYFNNCVVVVDTPAPFRYAERFCYALGGHLVSVHNSTVDDWLFGTARRALAVDANATRVLLGAYHDEAPSWTWTDGTFFDFRKWATGEPSQTGCVAMSIHTNEPMWYAVDCEDPEPFICVTPPKVPVCASGWTFYKGTDSCYYIGANLTFKAAEEYCVQYGGHLASVHNDEQNKFLIGLKPASGCATVSNGWTTTMWLGGWYREQFKHTHWVWSDGSDFDYEYFTEAAKYETGCIYLTTDSGCKDYQHWGAAGADAQVPFFACEAKAV